MKPFVSPLSYARMTSCVTFMGARLALLISIGILDDERLQQGHFRAAKYTLQASTKVVEPGCWRTPPPGSHRAASARPRTAPLAPARVAAIKVKAVRQGRARLSGADDSCVVVRHDRPPIS
jgi:hypothetical protein